MDEELCEVMDMPKVYCSHCTGADKRQKDEERHGEHYFFAKYPGWCKVGEHATAVGSFIVYRAAISGYTCEEHD